jgi:hypothetical protein
MRKILTSARSGFGMSGKAMRRTLKAVDFRRPESLIVGDNDAFAVPDENSSD